MSRVNLTDTFKPISELGLSCHQMVSEEGYQPERQITGDITMILQERGQQPQIIRMRNIITLAASVLVARLFKNKADPANGAFALAVGTGNPLWDPFNPPAASNTQTQLNAEIARKQFASTNFITATGTVSPTPTNIVDFTTFFAESEAVGSLVEMGLVGGDSTLAPNTGSLINYRTFKVISKSNTSTLSITWRLSF